MSIERITRSAPQHCFNGGQTGHGPIEPAYNPRKDLGWGMVCIVAVMAVVFGFAVATPDDRAMPSAPAVAASPSNPSVSPLRASIRIAGENNGRH